MLAIFKREFNSYFTNPMGYVFLAVFYFFSPIDIIFSVTIGFNIIPIFYLPYALKCWSIPARDASVSTKAEQFKIV